MIETVAAGHIIGVLLRERIEPTAISVGGARKDEAEDKRKACPDRSSLHDRHPMT